MGLHRCGLWSRGQASPASSESRDGSTPAVGTPESPGWERGPRRCGGRAGRSWTLTSRGARGTRPRSQSKPLRPPSHQPAVCGVWPVCSRLSLTAPLRPHQAHGQQRPRSNWWLTLEHLLPERVCSLSVQDSSPLLGWRTPRGRCLGGLYGGAEGRQPPGGLPRTTGGHVSRQAHGAVSAPFHPLPCVLVLPTLFMSEGGAQGGEESRPGVTQLPSGEAHAQARVTPGP